MNPAVYINILSIDNIDKPLPIVTRQDVDDKMIPCLLVCTNINI